MIAAAATAAAAAAAAANAEAAATVNHLPRLYKREILGHIWSFLRKPRYVDLAEKDAQGRTALQCARVAGQKYVARLLCTYLPTVLAPGRGKRKQGAAQRAMQVGKQPRRAAKVGGAMVAAVRAKAVADEKAMGRQETQLLPEPLAEEENVSIVLMDE